MELQKTVWDPLELELEVAVSRPVGAETEAWFLLPQSRNHS